MAAEFVCLREGCELGFVEGGEFPAGWCGVGCQVPVLGFGVAVGGGQGLRVGGAEVGKLCAEGFELGDGGDFDVGGVEEVGKDTAGGQFGEEGRGGCEEADGEWEFFADFVFEGAEGFVEGGDDEVAGAVAHRRF